jgi:hypothetical protein
MAEGNLVIFRRFDREDILEPTEEHKYCSKHAEGKKKELPGCEISVYDSSNPQFHCEVCSPVTLEDWGF